MRTAIIGGVAEPELPTFVVWLPMLPADNQEAARRSSKLVADPSVSQFYDPSLRVGHAIAASLGAAGRIAWDIYLFYPAGGEWTGAPPPPVDWMHQLGPRSWADGGRYSRGAALVDHLRRGKNRLLTAR